MEKLKFSDNNRYFVDSNNQPFSWIADTDWTMPQRISHDDIEYFLKKRKSQGFSVLQLVALDPEADEKIRNPIGQPALLNNDLNTPNEKYFEYLDWIIDEAERYGFYVLLLPVWGELVVGHNWMGKFSEKIVTTENAYKYGEWIGNRYKHKNNILWCLGGDRLPNHLGESYHDVWRLLAEGIAKGVTGKDLKYNVKSPEWKNLFMTYHACHDASTHECSTMSQWTDEEAWINFIMLQSGHSLDIKNYELVENEYNRENVMPVWDGEPAYEMMPTTWPDITDFHGSWMVRRRAYWSLFAGAFGFTYGHCSVWRSVSAKERNEMFRYTWFESLDCEGANQMKHLREFMDSVHIMTYTPCNKILPSENENADIYTHKQAAINQEQNQICVYLPSGGSLEVNLSDYNFNEAYIWWYNPKNGKFYNDIGETDSALNVKLNNNLLKVNAPSSGNENDWICIISNHNSDIPVKEKEYFKMEASNNMEKVFEW